MSLKALFTGILHAFLIFNKELHVRGQILIEPRIKQTFTCMHIDIYSNR